MRWLLTLLLCSVSYAAPILTLHADPVPLAVGQQVDVDLLVSSPTSEGVSAVQAVVGWDQSVLTFKNLSVAPPWSLLGMRSGVAGYGCPNMTAPITATLEGTLVATYSLEVIRAADKADVNIWRTSDLGPQTWVVDADYQLAWPPPGDSTVLYTLILPEPATVLLLAAGMLFRRW